MPGILSPQGFLQGKQSSTVKVPVSRVGISFSGSAWQPPSVAAGLGVKPMPQLGQYIESVNATLLQPKAAKPRQGIDHFLTQFLGKFDSKQAWPQHATLVNPRL
jgi:hypothetical protein